MGADLKDYLTSEERRQMDALLAKAEERWTISIHSVSNHHIIDALFMDRDNAAVYQVKIGQISIYISKLDKARFQKTRTPVRRTLLFL